MIDLSESIKEEQKRELQNRLDVSMTETQKLDLFDILGREAAKKAGITEEPLVIQVTQSKDEVFFSWIQEKITTEGLDAFLSRMIDSSEKINKTEKEFWQTQLSTMSEEEKQQLLDTFGREAFEKKEKE
jgi:hypothetical protein